MLRYKIIRGGGGCKEKKLYCWGEVFVFSVTLICQSKKLKFPREAGRRNPVHINSRFFGSINHMKTVTKLVVFGLYYRKNKLYNSKVLFHITNTICLSFFCIERNYILLCKQQRLPPTFKRTFFFQIFISVS